jgi:hypothetical protein
MHLLGRIVIRIAVALKSQNPIVSLCNRQAQTNMYTLRNFNTDDLICRSLVKLHQCFNTRTYLLFIASVFSDLTGGKRSNT